MKVKLALAAAAIMGAFAVSVPSQAAPLAGAGIATEAAKTDAKPMEQVHRRHYRGRHWRGRHYGATAVGGIGIGGMVDLPAILWLRPRLLWSRRGYGRWSGRWLQAGRVSRLRLLSSQLV